MQFCKVVLFVLACSSSILGDLFTVNIRRFLYNKLLQMDYCDV